MSMTYGALVGPKSQTGSIRNFVNYELIPAEAILEDAQAYIWGALRTREMRASVLLPVAAGDGALAVPADLLDPIKLSYPNGDAIDLYDESEFPSLRITDEAGTLEQGRPGSYAIYDERLHFDMAFDGPLTLELVYYKRPAALGPQNQSNWLSQRYPNLLRACLLMHAADFRQDDESYARWKGRTDELIGRAAVEADLARRGARHSRSS